MAPKAPRGPPRGLNDSPVHRYPSGGHANLPQGCPKVCPPPARGPAHPGTFPAHRGGAGTRYIALAHGGPAHPGTFPAHQGGGLLGLSGASWAVLRPSCGLLKKDRFLEGSEPPFLEEEEDEKEGGGRLGTLGPSWGPWEALLSLPALLTQKGAPVQQQIIGA